MTLQLASLLVHLESGGAADSEPFNWHPYIAAGLILIVLFGAMLALLAFGKGREHS